MDVDVINLAEKVQTDMHLRNADENTIILNAYKIDLTKACQIYKYELKFMGKRRRDEKEIKDLGEFPKNDVGSNGRRFAMNELFKLLLKTNKEWFKIDSYHSEYGHYIYDFRSTFYSTRKLLDEDKNKEFTLTLDALSDENKIRLRNFDKNITVHLLACETFDPQNLSNPIVLQFLDILTTQELIRKGKFFIYRSKAFPISSRNDKAMRGDPRIIKEGFSKEVRIVGDNPEDAMAVLQIRPKKTAFFPKMRLIDFVVKYLENRGSQREETDYRRGERETIAQKLNNNLDEVRNLLTGLVVETNYRTKNIQFEIRDISDTPCDEQRFPKDGEETIVSDYFLSEWNHRLAYPKLPCITKLQYQKLQMDNTNYFFPMELVDIVPGQRVPREKHTPQMKDQMVRLSQTNPSEYDHYIFEQRENAGISSTHAHDHNRFLIATGIEVSKTLMEQTAVVQFPPAIVYNRGIIDPDRHGFPSKFSRGESHWALSGQQFLEPANLSKHWAWVVTNVQSCLSQNELNTFIEKLLESAKQLGLTVPQPTPDNSFTRTDIEFVRDRFKEYEQSRISFVLFFSRDNKHPIHHHFKMMEIDFPNIVTQHVTKPTVNKGQRDWKLFQNILMKMNLKLGGINHNLATSRAFLNANRFGEREDIVSNEWFAKSKMFIGLSISHPASQQYFDRNSGIRIIQPSTVGMGYTLGENIVRIRGYNWYQETRLTHIKTEDLFKYVKSSIEHFVDQNRQYPRHIIVYRDGVSEGEFKHVLKYEESAFYQAFGDLQISPSPGLTIVVIQKDTNYRIIPVDANRRSNAPASAQNVRPGTCVDNKIMSPIYTEFLLVPHKAIQGTANPIRCTVIADKGQGGNANDRMDLDVLKHITHYQCFGHGIVTSPVSIPSVLYSAHDLAKRAHNNWKTRCGETEYGPSASSFKRALTNIKNSLENPSANNDKDYQAMSLTNEQRGHYQLTTKYWA